MSVTAVPLSKIDLKDVQEIISELIEIGAITETHLEVVHGYEDIESLTRLCRAVGSTANASAWWAGDLVLAVEKLHPSKKSQIIAAFDIAPETLNRWARTSYRIPPERRRNELSWSHHFVVSTLEESRQDLLLQRAVDFGYSKTELLHIANPSTPEARIAKSCNELRDLLNTSTEFYLRQTKSIIKSMKSKEYDRVQLLLDDLKDEIENNLRAAQKL